MWERRCHRPRPWLSVKLRDDTATNDSEALSAHTCPCALPFRRLAGRISVEQLHGQCLPRQPWMHVRLMHDPALSTCGRGFLKSASFFRSLTIHVDRRFEVNNLFKCLNQQSFALSPFGQKMIWGNMGKTVVLIFLFFFLLFESSFASFPNEFSSTDTKSLNIFSRNDIKKSDSSLDQYLIAYYPFNGNAHDESGHGHHGVVTGATLATDRNGTTHSSYFFDGSSYITVEADGSILNVDTNGWTISCWVKPDSIQSANAASMISYGYGRNGGYNVAYWYQYGMFVTTLYDYSWSGDYVSQDELDDITWYMYTTTYDGDTLRAYVNGVLVDEKPGTYFQTTNSYPLRFGADSSSASYFFRGYMDDIRLYRKALTDLEVAHISGLSGAIRATKLNAYSLADFEQGILKPAKFSNFWAVWGNNGNAYSEVVENPLKSGANTSDYVCVSHTFPSLPAPNTTDCDKSEYVLTSAHGLVTDQHHILKWKLLLTDDTILNIDDIVWDWMSFNQIHTGAAKYPKAPASNYPEDETIAYGGGIFNDLKKANEEDPSIYHFRYRAIPDEKLVPFHIKTGQWMSFTYEIVWTQSSKGYWRVWKDGELLDYANNVKTLPDSYDPAADDFLHFKTGLYNKWNDPVIDRLSLYFDDIELYIGDDIRVEDVAPECDTSLLPTKMGMHWLMLLIE
ncbi:MAG: hypothetical protein EOM25_11555 [Deltaproteobacteria bacterium]|nr:hypothetical protein [Deltaproteobacteria bacterium]